MATHTRPRAALHALLLLLLGLIALGTQAFQLSVPGRSARIPLRPTTTTITSSRILHPSLLPSQPKPRSPLFSSSSVSAPQPPQPQRRRPTLRLLLSALALVCVTGAAARAFPLLPSSSSARLLQASTAVAAPIASLQDTLAQTLGKGPLAPIALVLSWLLDALEVAADGAGWIINLLLYPVLTPFKYLLHILSSLASQGGGSPLNKDSLLLLLQHATQAATALGEGLAAYAQGVVALLFTSLGVVYRFVCNGLGLFFNMPGLQYLDTMDPRRHIPSNPTRFVAAKDIKLASEFGLKQMYGRRWTVHAGT